MGHVSRSTNEFKSIGALFFKKAFLCHGVYIFWQKTITELTAYESCYTFGKRPILERHTPSTAKIQIVVG